MNLRSAPRLPRSFAVTLSSDRFGQTYAIARNVSCGGMLLEAQEPWPLGTSVRVLMTLPETHAQVLMEGEIKHLYFLNFNKQGQARRMVGMGIRFTKYGNPHHHINAQHPTPTVATAWN